ncbi:MAG TPA: hypothetical protein VMU14_05115 [Acidimicrobiales bacterium]|nr:hypothetical protein [Acidimicrobiales bacterium]
MAEDLGKAANTDTSKGWARVWATARPFARPMPRAGGWYPVVGEASGDRAVLEVRGRRVAIQRKLLEIRPKRPDVFTVVVRSRGTVESVLGTRGQEIDRTYAVCPYCAERVRIFENQTQATCPGCGHHGEIAWWETG